MPAWQLQTGGMAQAGNRAGKTQCYLQWWDSGAECLAVTAAGCKVCNCGLIVASSVWPCWCTTQVGWLQHHEPPIPLAAHAMCVCVLGRGTTTCHAMPIQVGRAAKAGTQSSTMLGALGVSYFISEPMSQIIHCSPRNPPLFWCAYAFPQTPKTSRNSTKNQEFQKSQGLERLELEKDARLEWKFHPARVTLPAQPRATPCQGM